MIDREKDGYIDRIDVYIYMNIEQHLICMSYLNMSEEGIEKKSFSLLQFPG